MEQPGNPLIMPISPDPLEQLVVWHWEAGHVATLSEQVDGEVWVNCYDCKITARRMS